MKRLMPWRGGLTLIIASSVLGLLGLIPTIIGFWTDTRRALFSYLWAWTFWGGLALGSLLLLAIFHTARARWPVVLRRMIETTAAALPLLAVLFAPLLIGVSPLYSWVHTATLPEKVRHHVEEIRVWLNVPFWLGRSIAYLLIWAVLSELLLRWSRAQDERPDLGLTHRMRILSAAGLPWIAFALSFSALDWLMSNEPRWKSTIFGLYIFTGTILATLALHALLSVWARGPQLFGELVNESHRLALGRFLLAFTAFWAYIAYDQYMLVWIGDLPQEIPWYRVRTEGGWVLFAWLTVLMRFGVPILALLSRRLKTSPRGLAAISLWILASHAVDLYWVILPAINAADPQLRWTDLTAFVGLGGLTVAFVTWRLRDRYTVPILDPYLNESARYSHP